MESIARLDATVAIRRAIAPQHPPPLLYHKDFFLSFLVWFALGALAGIIARTPLKRPAKAVLLDVALGVAGAVLAGWLFNTSRGLGASRLNPNSLPLALLGAIVVLNLYHTVFRRRSPAG